VDPRTIAAQVRSWRIRRDLTQQQLADALGRHLTWVKKFEAGDRQADPRISLLVEIGRVLDVPLEVLLAPVLERASTPNDHEADVAEVRAALLRPVGAVEPRPRADLARQVIYCYDAYQAGNYRVLGRLLPELLVDTRAATGASPGDPVARHALAETYHLTSITLMKFGDANTAWHAADRALTTAETLNDPVVAALSAQALVWAAAGVGQGSAGVAVAQYALDGNGSELAKAGEDGWTALGMLQLKAAVAAAAIGDASVARDMIANARSSARHVAADANVRRTGFNGTNVLLYEASVLGQLGDHGGALNAATRIHPSAFAALPRERRTHHLVDTASSALAAGQPDAALSLLLQAERDSPQEVLNLPAARVVISELGHARQTMANAGGLRELARRAGVAG
jgi:transcriptional regulator with XRE-family HTH domain